MKKINNFESVQASTGEFAKPTPNGYVCVIKSVEDMPMDASGKGDYLKIRYDFADGEFEGYFEELFDKFNFWGGEFIRSYKDKALGMFKHFINCVEASNSGFVWDWQETNLENMKVGLVIGEKEYLKNDGSVGRKYVVKDVKTVEDIRNGNFKIPQLEKLQEQQPTMPQNIAEQFMNIQDDEIPF